MQSESPPHVKHLSVYNCIYRVTPEYSAGPCYNNNITIISNNNNNNKNITVDEFVITLI